MNRFFSQLTVVVSAVTISFIHLSWLFRGSVAFLSVRPWYTFLRVFVLGRLESKVSFEPTLLSIGRHIFLYCLSAEKALKDSK